MLQDLIATARSSPTLQRGTAIARRIYRRATDPRVTRVVGAAVQIAALAIVVYLVVTNWATLMAVDWAVQPGLLLAMVGVSALVFLIWATAWRVEIAIAGQGRMGRELRVHAYNNLVRRIPFVNGAWLYVGKPVYYEPYGFAKRHVFLLTLLDLAMQAASVALVACALLVADPALAAQHPTLSLALGFAGTLSGALLLALAIAPLDRLERWTNMPPAMIRKARTHLLGAAGIYAGGWLFAGLTAWLFFNGTTAQFNLPYRDALFNIVAAGAIGYFVALIPAPLRGVTELSYAFLMSSYFGASVAGVIALGYTLVFAVIEVVLCLVTIRLTKPS